MSAALLDTSVALLALSDPDRLPHAVRRAVMRGSNVLSVVSYWEVLLKSMKGLLEVGDLRVWWADALDQLAAVPLPLRPEHVAGICDLPSIHKDPFDRALIAQATVEHLAMVTIDGDVARYASAHLRVVS